MSEDLPVITITAIQIADCLRKFNLHNVKHLRFIVKREARLDGSIHHIGQELGEDAMLKELDRLYPIYGQDDEDKKSIKTAMHLGMLRGSLLAFKTPDGTLNEVEWLLPVINPDTGRHSKLFQVGGKADKVNVERGGLYEYKTTGETPSQSKILSLPLDRQIHNAISGVQRKTGCRIDEVYYRFIRKPSIKQTQKESVRQFYDRLLADYLDPARRDFYFKEERLLIAQEEVRDWERDLWDTIHILHYCYKHNHWPRNSSRCAEWGGCEYLPMCRGENCDGMFEISEPNPELSKEARIGVTTNTEDEAA